VRRILRRIEEDILVPEVVPSQDAKSDDGRPTEDEHAADSDSADEEVDLEPSRQGIDRVVVERNERLDLVVAV
jgi:hypothetical protein